MPLTEEDYGTIQRNRKLIKTKQTSQRGDMDIHTYIQTCLPRLPFIGGNIITQ